MDRKPKLQKAPQSIQDLLVELASLKMQTTTFFVKERKLCGVGLNPKVGLDMAVVTANRIEEVWRKYSSFKLTNTILNLETRKELLQLYAKIYKKAEVTNKEFMA